MQQQPPLVVAGPAFASSSALVPPPYIGNNDKRNTTTTGRSNMSPHHRKRANSRGTFLLVDGQTFDISNICHESTERIPEEVTVVIRKSCLQLQNLYPSVSNLQQQLQYSSCDELLTTSVSSSRYADEVMPFVMARTEEGVPKTRPREESSSSESSSSSSEDESSVLLMSSSPAAMTTTDTQNTPDESSGRFAATENDDDNGWHRVHQSLASINWVPPAVSTCEEKAEMVKRNDGETRETTVQLPGAVRVGEESTLLVETKLPVRGGESLLLSWLDHHQDDKQSQELTKPGAICVEGARSDAGDHSVVQQHQRKGALNHHGNAPGQGIEVEQKLAATSPQVWSPREVERATACSDGGHRSANSVQLSSSKDDDDDDDDGGFENNEWEVYNDDDPEYNAPRFHQPVVQVTCDLELPLHGAEETSRALQQGNVVTVVCLVCRATLRCINIAQYVLCPECKCVTPLETTNTGGTSTGGVGLGLLSTFDQR